MARGKGSVPGKAVVNGLFGYRWKGSSGQISNALFGYRHNGATKKVSKGLFGKR